MDINEAVRLAADFVLSNTYGEYGYIVAVYVSRGVTCATIVHRHSPEDSFQMTRGLAAAVGSGVQIRTVDFTRDSPNSVLQGVPEDENVDAGSAFIIRRTLGCYMVRPPDRTWVRL